MGSIPRGSIYTTIMELDSLMELSDYLSKVVSALIRVLSKYKIKYKCV